MASKACVSRLNKEYKALLREPLPHILAHPSLHNILEWNYVLEGPADTDYEGGVYWGKIVFPPQYPYKPPDIKMLTPSGRFAVNERLCMSMSSFHPETWNPLWSVGNILNGILSFMAEETHTTGSIRCSSAERRRLAQESLAANVRVPVFAKTFPQHVERWREQERRQAEGRRRDTGSSADGQEQAEQEPQEQGPGRGKDDSLLGLLVVVVAVAVVAAAVLLASLLSGSGSAQGGLGE